MIFKALSSLVRPRLFFLVFIPVVVIQAGWAQAPGGYVARGGSPKSPDELHQLWNANVVPALQKLPTTSALAYNDGGMLMVPLHGAFKRQDAGWERDFADHFQMFIKSTSSLTDVTLSRLQYLYLASEFIVLAQKNGHPELIPAGLPDFLFSQISAIWQEQPSSGYEHAPFHGMRERVLWKLNTPRVAKSYSRAILDDELFLFGIAADLRTFGGNPQELISWRQPLNDMLETLDRIFRHEIARTPSGGWLLQPGVWADHPDFKFAGNYRAERGIRPAPVADIAWDSSHSLRFPLWITSFMNAYTPGSPEYNFYSDLRQGLNQQFFSKVVVPPSVEFPCYRLNNYMDGRDGVYRWEYGELGPNNGYGPFQASGSLMLGWWAFLNTDDSKKLYHNIADEYPWSKDCLQLYLGPGTGGREYTAAELTPNHPAFTFRYLIVRLASEL